MRLSFVNTCWWTLYVACMLAVVGGMFQARKWSTAAYGTDSAQAEWQEWRSAVEFQSYARSPTSGGPARPNPVQRDVPQSTEPPALVLMRDYFGICLVFAVVLTSALFATTMIALRGAFRTTFVAVSE